MEKMNQVSVTEFMSKSKEEMYDMAVEMVEKYNRLVDICNDSAERMADLMSKDNIDGFKKELQSKEIGEFKIQKLADVIVWVDNQIEELRMDFPYVTEEEFENFQTVSELEAVKEAVNNAIKRHAVYTQALKNNYANKEAEVKELTKELEGRKKAFNDLREEMATRYMPIETHNDICKTYEEKATELEKEIERLNRYSTNVDKVNHDLVVHVTLLESEKEEIEKLKVDLIHEREKNEKLAKAHAELENDMRKTAIDKNKEIEKLNRFLKMQEDLTRDWKNKYVEAQKELDEWESDSSEYETIIQYQELIDGLNKDLSYWKEAFETQATSLADVRKCNEELEKQVKYLKKELEQTCTTKELDLKGHQRREMALVNDLADKNDLIKNLIQESDYYKNQERIRTDQLRATESKVDQLSREKEEKEKDHGRAGFEEYIKYIIAEEEGKFKAELNKRFSEEVSKISQKRTEEELAKMKGVGRTSSGRYPWGDTNVPCGEDAIE